MGTSAYADGALVKLRVRVPVVVRATKRSCVLVFSSYELPSREILDNALCVVPMRGSAQFAGTSSAVHISHIPERMAQEQFGAIHAEVHKGWLRFLTQTNIPAAKYFSYIYFTLLTPVVYWRHIVRTALNEYEPTHVAFEGLQPKHETSPIDRSTFLNWALVQLLEEEMDAFPKVTWNSSPRSRLTEIVPRSGRNLDIGSLLDTLFLPVFHASRIRRNTHRFTPSFARALSSDPAVLIQCQEKKSWQLRATLGELGIGFKRLEGDEIFGSPTPWNIAADDTILRTLTLEEGIDWYLNAMVTSLDEQQSRIQAFVEGPWSVLLTDQEWDPRMRLLIELSLSNGKHVALVPEGAQWRLGESVRHFYENVYMIGSGATRFTTSESETNFASNTEVSSVETGYLGDTCSYPKLLSRLYGWLMRLLAQSKGFKGIALVSLEYDARSGLGRAGQPSADMNLASTQSALGILRQEGWFTLVSLKTNESADDIRRAVAGPSVLVHTRIPWQVLALASDVVIQRDSSVGREAHSLGIPVIIWDDKSLPLASVDLLKAKRPSVWLAQSNACLQGVLQSLTGQLPKTRTTRRKKLQHQTPQLCQWLESHSLFDSQSSKN